MRCFTIREDAIHFKHLFKHNDHFCPYYRRSWKLRWNFLILNFTEIIWIDFLLHLLLYTLKVKIGNFKNLILFSKKLNHIWRWWLTMQKNKCQINLINFWNKTLKNEICLSNGHILKVTLVITTIIDWETSLTEILIIKNCKCFFRIHKSFSWNEGNECKSVNVPFLR